MKINQLSDIQNLKEDFVNKIKSNEYKIIYFNKLYQLFNEIDIKNIDIDNEFINYLIYKYSNNIDLFDYIFDLNIEIEFGMKIKDFISYISKETSEAYGWNL